MLRCRSVLLALLLAGSALAPALAVGAAGPTVRLLPASGPRVFTKATAVTFRVKVTGLTLDGRHIGKAARSGYGHLQVYADAIPGDAWTKRDLQHHWLASVASPTFQLRLSAAILGGKGRHRIIVALARNNDVLYRAPTATLAVTVKG